jgi:hypothetical protein
VPPSARISAELKARVRSASIRRIGPPRMELVSACPHPCGWPLAVLVAGF